MRAHSTVDVVNLLIKEGFTQGQWMNLRFVGGARLSFKTRRELEAETGKACRAVRVITSTTCFFVGRGKALTSQSGVRR